ncbi:glycoside hydrolase family 3 N-terminal domain-containing protein [Humibacillus xanthopallidus]|uniref:beta-glucosidase n=1 Tax=Humibacillus xanthopallidus TaxID=412689 RepID=A0A543I3H9_9MICO|nr:glycoside hydrolase family 3 N-terminal domain-containing protein [Humibacillus xanthopallidus]TQM65142.1 beta-glucosidase [Humibacillus xanthopallidus]
MTSPSGPSERPWFDATLPTETRIDILMEAMTLSDKVAQTHQVANIDPEADADALRAGRISSSLYASGATAGNERDAGVLVGNIDAAQRHAVEGSRLGIPVLFGRDVIHGHRTVGPIPLGLAASFDPSLAEEVAAIAAREAVIDGVAWTFAPMVDLSEEPRWGRVAESLGETPVLSGRLAAALVRGFQGDDVSDPDRLAACAKHFVGYGLAAGGRDYDTVSVGENTLRNLHLRPFKAAVDAGVTTVMAAFNDVDGTPMHAHERLIRDVLKGEWGFDGVVVADWNGVGQLVNAGVAADLREAAALAIRAGVDLDMCSGAYLAHLVELVESGEVDVALVDDAVRRVLRLKLRLGLFDRPYAVRPGASNAPTPETREVALRAGQAAHVLVKNDGVLPLDASAGSAGTTGSAGSTGSTGSVLLSGAFVDDGDALLGTWVLDGRPEEVVTPGVALRERLGDHVTVADGRFSDVTLMQARVAETTVLLLGEHRSRSGEAQSVTDIGLPPGQLDVLRAVAALGKPLVAVVYTGRPLDLSEVLDLAGAVLVVWHPGTEAGNALADVLLGEVEPHGRLPMTFPLSTGHIPTSTHQRPTGRLIRADVDHREGRYIDALTYSRLPFGFGLSYTTVEYSAPTVSSPTLATDGSVTVSVTVTNTGDRPCREVVQLYLRDPVAEVTRPLVELTDWSLVDLEPGQAREVTFDVRAEQAAYAGRDLTTRVDEGEIVLLTGPDAAHLGAVSVTVRRSS